MFNDSQKRKFGLKIGLCLEGVQECGRQCQVSYWSMPSVSYFE